MDKQEDSMAVSVRDAAKLLSISERTLWSLAKRGEVPSLRIGRRLLFVRSQLIDWLVLRTQPLTNQTHQGQ